MNELLQAAIAEAYASAPQDEIALHALEVNHYTFSAPIRVIRWPVTDEEPEKFECLLEDDAPYNPAKIVEYLGAPFEIILPEKDTNSPGQFQIRVDNVGDMLDEYMENAALGGQKITAIYREFIKGRESEGPCASWPNIVLSNPHMEGLTLVMDGAVLDWMFRAFGKLMLPGSYPALASGR